MSDKATEDEEEEIWKTYPKISFIEASNLGRVRTKDRVVMRKDGKKYFVKGRVLKQQLRKDGYMQVNLRMNGKSVNLYTHRIVVASHLPNPDNLPEVNHIDCDRTNNRLDNLEWCTSQYNIAYCVKLGRWKNNNPGRPVFAVDLETGKVFCFESQAEAARKLGVSRGNIGSVIRGELNTAGGYWFTEDKSEITEEKIREIKAKMHFLGGVIAINLDTSEVFWFESQAEAARQLNISTQSINGVVKGRQNKACGYWFFYVNEDVAEKVRKRFGDNVAHKIEELINKN